MSIEADVVAFSGDVRTADQKSELEAKARNQRFGRRGKASALARLFPPSSTYTCCLVAQHPPLQSIAYGTPAS